MPQAVHMPDHRKSADRWLVPLLFVLTAVWPLFMHLDTLPLRMWDEARQAISAWEMYHGSSWLVASYDGAPDMWSTKPPLLIWVQTALFALLGPGELALRLPSAFAALAIGWIMLRACGRFADAPWLGLMAATVLYTSTGFVNMHGARSGDYDVPLTLFMLLSALALYRWVEHDRPRDLFLTFVWLALGVLTKSVQALFFLPGLFVLLLLRRRLLPLLRQRAFYAGALFFVVVVAAFYLGREALNPGYLQAVWENELGGRFASPLEGHRGPWNFYILRVVDELYTPWWIAVPVGLVLGLAHRDERLRRWTTFVALLAGGYLLVISAAQTKLVWYATPLFPLLAVLSALPLYMVLHVLFTETSTGAVLRWRVLPGLFLFLVFVQPYSTMVGRCYFPKESDWDRDVFSHSHYLHKAVRGGPLEADVLCMDKYDAHVRFYVLQLQEQGKDIRILPSKALRPGMRVLFNDWEVHHAIDSTFRSTVLLADGNLRIHLIDDRNGHTP